MNLADDDRGRVPFALLAVVLLVGSASYAATLSHRPDPAGRPDSVAAMNRVDATIDTAVHRGTKRAARAAAAAPVLEPADTPAGRAIGRNDTFRRYLRLRIYLAVRQDLAAASVTVGSARATPSLPGTPNETALRRAIRRVSIERVAGGLRVTVADVGVRLRRGERVVDQRTRTVTRTVSTPVLAVHDGVVRYEERLNRGPSEGPGLGRRLTARANAVAWARGYAQYGGAPIGNVLTNRHLELVTNGALLSTQRAVFGRSDPAGRRATTRATAVVGATDVLWSGMNAADELRGLVGRAEYPSSSPPPKPPTPVRPPSAADGNLTVGVDLTADRAYAVLMTGRGNVTLNDTLGDVYGLDVRFLGTSSRVASSLDPPGRPSGLGWRRTDERTTQSVTVEPTNESVPRPTVAGDWHRLWNVTRRVVVVETIRERWVRGIGSGREVVWARGTRTRTSLVRVTVAGRHAHSRHAPSRGIDRVHEPGGPLDGPNLAGAVERARDAVAARFTVKELVRLHLDGELSDVRVEVGAEQPDGLRRWLTPTLSRLRERVRGLSVTVPRTRLGAGETNPAALLAAKLRNRRSEFVDPPTSYDSVAEKAKVAARGAYVAAVLDRLERRARETRRTRSGFDEALAEFGIDPETVGASLDVGSTSERPPARPLSTGGPLGRLNASVSTSPAYMTTAGVTHDRLPSVPAGERYHPLVVRNQNLFTVPYGDVADGIVDHVFGRERTSLRTAVRTLRSANRALDREHDPALAARRDELRVAVDRSLAFLRERLRDVLISTRGLSRREAVAAVEAGFGRWTTSVARGSAALNGSLATAVAAAAEPHLDRGREQRGGLLDVRLRAALARARRAQLARPREGGVNRTSTAVRGVLKEEIKGAVSGSATIAAKQLKRKLGGKLTLAPAGLPVAPVPGYWYATTNVWSVTVRGAYLRFAVSVPSGSGQLTYQRERDHVALDWDGDGDRDRLGRSTRVTFDVATAAVVVVPPGGPGVGDRDGNADERSAGWPDPGNATNEVTTTSTSSE